MHQAGHCKMQLKPIAGGTKLIVSKSPCNGLFFRKRWKGMMISDEQREENFQEYLRLLKDPDYYDVYFDEQSGGVSAIHKEHQFDKSIGPFNIKRGLYELMSVNALVRTGHCFILGPELSTGLDVCKASDGLLDGISAEIKAVESCGRWAIRTKLMKARKQGAAIVILYFHKRYLFSYDRVRQGWKEYIDALSENDNIGLICVVEKNVIVIEKPSW